MITRKQKLTIDSQTQNKTKIISMEKHDFKGRQQERNKHVNYKTSRNYDGTSKNSPVNNYFRCKWIEISNQMPEWLNE